MTLFLGTFQTNSAKFTIGTYIDIFCMYKSIYLHIRYSEEMCAPNHALHPRGIVVLNKIYLWSISGIQYVQCNYSAQ